MLVEYDGAAFHGWQIQPDHPTVQEAIESALEVVLKTRPDVTGSGRTDAGVHARGQVAHFDAEQPLDAHRLRRSLNGLLPRAVRVHYLEETRPDFHARYDARGRRYHYYVSTVPTALGGHTRWELRPVPDFDMMNGAAVSLIGRHDFDAFCRVQSETHNRVCTVRHARWIPEPAAYPTPEIELWRFEIVADRFLHGMVRAIVGTLMEVGRGKRPPEDISRILDSGNRREAGPAAPARGLVLEHVLYDEPFRRP
jgi:tRNA pseudouridine38-40 synthase